MIEKSEYVSKYVFWEQGITGWVFVPVGWDRI